MGGFCTEDGSASGIGKRSGGRGPGGGGGTSPKRGASSGRRPAAWPASMAAAASSAPMIRTPSLLRRGRTSSGSSLSLSSVGRSVTVGPPGSSDLEELLLLVLHHVVDLEHVLVGELLELLLGPLELVGGDLAPALEGLEVVTGGATQVAQRHPALFGLVLHDLHQILAPLLGELGED